MHGGKRIGAGRKKGSPNKASIQRQAEIAASGLTPLDWMLSVLRDEKVDYDRRDKAARDAAPYVHPRLSSTDLTSKGEKLGPALIIDRTSDDHPTPASKAGNGARLNGH